MADSSPLAHSPTLSAGDRDVSATADGEGFAAGTAIGEYVVERFIGGGAMGEVYAGRHPVIGKRVAIKVLRHQLAASTEAAERFIREARAVNQIDHENVIDVFAFGRLDDGRLYLVMDLVEGRSLRAHLIDGPLEAGVALDILAPIADALDAAHARGVVHRDLKPDNIVLSNATPPKVFVLDFGIAKLISKANEGKPTGPGTLTGAGTWLGTPTYMAPEQWSVDGAGPASDRYALGVIAFELLAGAPPFSATSVPAMMEQHFRADVPALSARGAVGVPAAVDAVLRKALAKDPAARYPTARELVDALRAAVGSHARGARAAVATSPASRKLWVPAAAGAGVLGLGVVVILSARGDSTPSAATTEPERPAGTVAVDVRSTPAGGEIVSGSKVLGRTPAQLFLKPGEELTLLVRKPGYVSDSHAVRAGTDSVVDIKLTEVTRFQGVWRLDNGELRKFERRGDEVDVFKVQELAGNQEFFRTYRFALADHGVVFAGEETVADPYAPQEPSCNIRMKVEYHYDPTHDVLAQHREKAKLQYAAGKCIIASRTVEPIQLVRVVGSSETAEISTPVGVPEENPELSDKLQEAKVKKPTKREPQEARKKVLPLDPKAELGKNVDAKQAPVTQKPRKSAKEPPESALNNSFGGKESLPSPQQQIAPQQPATPPQANSAQQPLPQQSATPIQKK